MLPMNVLIGFFLHQQHKTRYVVLIFGTSSGKELLFTCLVWHALTNQTCCAQTCHWGLPHPEGARARSISAQTDSNPHPGTCEGTNTVTHISCFLCLWKRWLCGDMELLGSLFWFVCFIFDVCSLCLVICEKTPPPVCVSLLKLIQQQPITID